MSVRWAPISRETVWSIQARRFRRRRNHWLRKARVEKGRELCETYVAFARAAHCSFMRQLKLHRAFRGAPLCPFTRRFSTKAVRL